MRQGSKGSGVQDGSTVQGSRGSVPNRARCTNSKFGDETILSQAEQTTDYRVQLEIFEGPLDLLLHLIRSQELEISDIPIAKITRQYLDYLELMRELNIGVAGDYLVMAATLIHIKSKMLLPVEPGEEGELEDPRKELVDQLLEHEKFRNAAQMLFSRETVELSVWPRGENEFEDEEKELVSVSTFELIKAFHAVVERFKEQVVLEVDRETVTLEVRIAEIRRLLTVNKEFLFSHFFEQKISKLALVVTIIALLELVRTREVRIFQKRAFADFRIQAC